MTKPTSILDWLKGRIEFALLNAGRGRYIIKPQSHKVPQWQESQSPSSFAGLLMFAKKLFKHWLLPKYGQKKSGEVECISLMGMTL